MSNVAVCSNPAIWMVIMIIKQFSYFGALCVAVAHLALTFFWIEPVVILYLVGTATKAGGLELLRSRLKMIVNFVQKKALSYALRSTRPPASV